MNDPTLPQAKTRPAADGPDRWPSRIPKASHLRRKPLNDMARHRALPAGFLRAAFLAALVTATLPVATEAASFPCDKAGTRVEQLICGDPELSALDDRLAERYAKALGTGLDPEFLREQQKAWLKERAQCKETACLRERYAGRIGELERFAALVPSPETQESHAFKSERDKLVAIQDTLRHQRLVPLLAHIKHPPFCSEFLAELQHGHGVKAVEPDFTALSSEDPRLDEINACEEHWMENPIPQEAFHKMLWEGSPPYRVYRGAPGRGKNEWLVYREYHGLFGNTGYLWMDTQGCVVVGGAPVASKRRLPPLDESTLRLNTVVEFHGEWLVVDLHPASKGYRFGAWLMNPAHGTPSCDWKEEEHP